MSLRGVIDESLLINFKLNLFSKLNELINIAVDNLFEGCRAVVGAGVAQTFELVFHGGRL